MVINKSFSTFTKKCQVMEEEVVEVMGAVEEEVAEAVVEDIVEVVDGVVVEDTVEVLTGPAMVVGMVATHLDGDATTGPHTQIPTTGQSVQIIGQHMDIHGDTMWLQSILSKPHMVLATVPSPATV
jgi:hypothetical protein